MKFFLILFSIVMHEGDTQPRYDWQVVPTEYTTQEECTIHAAQFFANVARDPRNKHIVMMDVKCVGADYKPNEIPKSPKPVEPEVQL